MMKIKTACIIDDDEIYVWTVQRLIDISKICENVMVFHNGEEAINSLKPLLESGENAPEVILLDINMPIMDGWDFLEEFVKIKCKKKTTLYMISSSNNEEDIQRAKEIEVVNDFIVKPLSMEKIKEIFMTDS